MEKPTPIFKSKRRHLLKEIDKKWHGRMIRTKVETPKSHALTSLKK